MGVIGKFAALFVVALAITVGGAIFSDGGFAASPAKAATKAPAKTVAKPKVTVSAPPKVTAPAPKTATSPTTAKAKAATATAVMATAANPSLGVVTASGKSLAVASPIVGPTRSARRVSFGTATPPAASGVAAPHGFGSVTAHSPQSSVHLEMVASN